MKKRKPFYWAAKQLAVNARDGDWAQRRVGNLRRMLAKAKKDDAVLFAGATFMLDALSRLFTSVGDEAGSLYAQSLARLLEAKIGKGHDGPTGSTGTNGRVRENKS